ncbi:hypothetical protein BHE74_00047236 [Ensete ventricosum]|nr:hypothetical protein BHE74_00047236 [Ensete ventricosum]
MNRVVRTVCTAQYRIPYCTEINAVCRYELVWKTLLNNKVFHTDLYHLYRAVHIDLPDYRYADRPLSGGTAKIDRHRSISFVLWALHGQHSLDMKWDLMLAHWTLEIGAEAGSGMVFMYKSMEIL